MTEIQTILLTAFIGIVIAYARYVHNLKERVSVLEKTVVDMRDEMLNVTGNLMNTIENIQKRQDSHSKKQDDIMNLLTAFKIEILKEVGKMSSNVTGLASDVKHLSNVIMKGS